MLNTKNTIILSQIKNLRKRLRLIKNMQLFGVVSFFMCVLCMVFFYFEHEALANTTFGLSLIFLLTSLLISIKEILISTHALEIELSDMES